jgi:glutaredoxin
MMSLLRMLVAVGALSLASLAAFPAPVEAACLKKVTLYSAYWCPYCRQVRNLLGRYRVPYSLVEVSGQDGQEIMLLRFGDTGVPRTVIGGTVVEGADLPRIKQLLCLK